MLWVEAPLDGDYQRFQVQVLRSQGPLASRLMQSSVQLNLLSVLRSAHGACRICSQRVELDAFNRHEKASRSGLCTGQAGGS